MKTEEKNRGAKSLIFALISLCISIIFLSVLLFLPYNILSRALRWPNWSIFLLVSAGTAIIAIILGAKNLRYDRKFSLPGLRLGIYKLIILPFHIFLAFSSFFYYISRPQTIPLIVATSLTDFPVQSFLKMILPCLIFLILNVVLFLIFLIHYIRKK